MELAYLDQLANKKENWLSKCSLIPKLLLSGTFVVLSVVSTKVLILASLSALLFCLNLFNGISLKKLLYLMLYPVIFSLIFALLRFNYSLEAGFTIIFRALNAALAMLLLIASTPYPQLFSFLRLFLPNVVVEGMFFAYRLFFLMLQQVSNILTVLKLKGGPRAATFFVYFKQLMGAIGLIFINAFDLAQRMQHIYAIRGYQGQIGEDRDWLKFNRFDFFPVILSLITLLAVVIF